MSSRDAGSRTLLRVFAAIVLLANLVAGPVAQAAPPPARPTAAGGPAGPAAPTATPSQRDGKAPTARVGTPARPKAATGPKTASPSSGSVLRQFNAPNPTGASYNGRAIAFDGTNLWITYYQSSSTGVDHNLYEISTSGVSIQTFNVGTNLGALAWDTKRNLLWGAEYASASGKVYTINPSSGALTYQFTFVPPGTKCPTQASGMIDGLSYDPASDTLWISDDGGSVVYNVSTTGSQISSFPMSLSGFSCNSGIALQTYAGGGESLWLAEPNADYVVHTDLSGNPLIHR